MWYRMLYPLLSEDRQGCSAGFSLAADVPQRQWVQGLPNTLQNRWNAPLTCTPAIVVILSRGTSGTCRSPAD